MIKIRIRNASHEIDVRFPISESELFAKLAEIHAVEGRNAAQSAYGKHENHCRAGTGGPVPADQGLPAAQQHDAEADPHRAYRGRAGTGADGA